MRLGRLVGIGIGIVILLVVFFVPFGAIPGYVQHGDTLYTAFSGAMANVPQVQNSGSFADAGAILVLAVAGLLLLIAGIVGIFPLGTGVLGAVGMALLTVGPYFTGHISSYSAASFDIGFYALWVASIAALVMSFVGKNIPVLNRNIQRKAKETAATPE